MRCSLSDLERTKQTEHVRLYINLKWVSWHATRLT
jgi:hypothetical protein